MIRPWGRRAREIRRHRQMLELARAHGAATRRGRIIGAVVAGFVLASSIAGILAMMGVRP